MDTIHNPHEKNADISSEKLPTSVPEKQWTIEEVDQLIQEQDEIIARLEKETQEFFENLGVDQNEFLEFINDRSRFTYEAWDAMEKERAKLQALLDISEKKEPKATSKEKKKASRSVPREQWIFIR